MSNLSIRLYQARNAAGLSLRELAIRVSLSHAAIKKYEDGKVYPSSDTLIRLARALKVRPDFFFRPIKVNLKDIKFRKRKQLTRKAEEKIKFEIIGQIERRLELENLCPPSLIIPFTIPPSLLQKINSFEDIEILAEQLRNYWELGFDPIYDLINILELRGIRIFIVDSDEKDFDALSAEVNNQPIVVISSKWPSERQRFNLMHELAHYILINRLSSSTSLKEEEKFCNRFAAAFLLPRKIAYQIVGMKRHAIEWQELRSLKTQFQLSMKAICLRLKDLQVIRESYFKGMMIRFQKNGWNYSEPEKIPLEQTRIFHQMIFHALGEEYIGESKAAELLCCSITKLKTLRRMENATTHQRY